ncbi:CFP-6 [Nocardia otitidiscaviarum]|uniref:CFP-6 n=1 Tax=Nocardia otitidiscaviarum TaxID=1823 RepID=A0A378YR40_9NOCA|nr:PH domain-containing protein [Nocardia otitidiscaviarum]MBF6238876.1 PH domain-containing protein [Nocardia otitidiscaviarum]SUA78967.1 CFP-6 [Nocardia otitidiscaviarum]
MSSPHQSVPPGRSSHTPAAGSDTGGYPSIRFRTDWLWIPAVAIVPLVVTFPLWLTRLQTVVSGNGLEVRGLFRTRRVPWQQISGVRIPGFNRVYATLADGSEIPLPGVDFGRIRTFVRATRGELADPGVRVIAIPRLAHLAVFVVALGALFPFAGWPQVLWILFAIPLALAVWVERTRTKISPDGLDLRTVRGRRHIDWDQVKGLSIPQRGYLRLHLADDSEVKLPAVGYDRLRDLVEASGGRIPDPFVEPEDEDETADAADAETTGGRGGAVTPE